MTMRLPGDLRELATLRTDDGGGFKPVLVGPFEGFHQIGRISTHARRQQQVTAAGIVLELPHKDVVVAVVVPQRREPGDIIGEREHAEALRQFVRRSFAQIRGKVRGVGRAATISDSEDLRVPQPCSADGLRESFDLFNRHAVERAVLFRDVVLEPGLHGVWKLRFVEWEKSLGQPR